MTDMTYEDGRWRILNEFRGIRSANFDIELFLFVLVLYKNKSLRIAIQSLSTMSKNPNDIVRDLSSAIQSADIDYSSAIINVLHAVEPEFNQMAQSHNCWNLFHRIFNFLSTLDDSWYDEYFSCLFDDILFWMADNSVSSVIVQPKELIKLMTAISEYGGHGTVYNPYADCASFEVEMKVGPSYFGEELNLKTWAIGTLRLIAHNISLHHYVNSDSYNSWSGKSWRGINGNFYDFIFSTPPLNCNTRKSDEHRDPFKSFEYIEEDFLNRGSLSLNEHGELIGLVGHRILFSEKPAIKDLRRRLIDEGLIDTVILLPSNILYGTNTPSVIIKLKNDRIDKSITFIDAHSCSIKNGRRHILDYDEILKILRASESENKVFVSNDEIVQQHYNLNPRVYLSRVEVPKGYFVVRCNEICTELQPDAKPDIKAPGYLFTTSVLPDDPFNWRVDPATFQNVPYEDGYVVLKQPFVALSKTGTFRPRVINASENFPVFLPKGTVAIAIDESKVFIPLFLLEWENAFNKWSITQRLPISEIQKLPVVVPDSIDAQKSLYSSLDEQHKLAKVREYGLENLIAKQKDDFINVLRNRKHNLDNCMGAIMNCYSPIRKYIERSGLSDKPLSEYNNTTVGGSIERLGLLLANLQEQIKHIAEENIFGPAEKIDILSEIYNIKPHGNYRIEREIGDLPILDIESPFSNKAFVKINGYNFNVMVNNIIGNAEKHGFVNSNRLYVLKVRLSYDFDDKMYVISFANNGVPMPNGMNTLRYGIDGEKGANSTGTGKGGAIVKNIVEHFDGKYEVFNDPLSLFPVEILIKLPRYDD